MLSTLMFFLNSLFSSSQSILYLFDAANLGCSDSYWLDEISISIPFLTRESAALLACDNFILEILHICSGVIFPFLTMRRKILDSSDDNFSSVLRTFSRLAKFTDNEDRQCLKLFFKIVHLQLTVLFNGFSH